MVDQSISLAHILKMQIRPFRDNHNNIQSE